MPLLLAQPALCLVDEAFDVLRDLPAVHLIPDLLSELLELLLDLAKDVRDPPSLFGAFALAPIAGAGRLSFVCLEGTFISIQTQLNLI